MKAIFAMNGFGSCKPGKYRHQNHDAFLNSPRPLHVSAGYRGNHDASQQQEIPAALDVYPAMRLNFVDEGAVRAKVILQELVLIVKIEYHQQSRNRSRPDWK